MIKPVPIKDWLNLILLSPCGAGLNNDLGLETSCQYSATVHFLRNLLAKIPRKDREQVAAAPKLLFGQSDRELAGATLHRVAAALQPRWPRAQKFSFGLSLIVVFVFRKKDNFYCDFL